FNYSTSGTDWTYKVGGRWQLVPDITLRSTYSTAFRAPSISNLYTGQLESFFEGVQDPCAGPLDPASARAKSCGLAANNGAEPGAILRYGGNPDLKPERATVFTAGVVLEPRFVPNFTVTADYYNIVIDQAIVAGLFPNDILNACYPDQPGVAPKYCDLVQRDPTTQ